MVTPPYSDEQLLELLERDLEKGAAVLVDQYSNILWGVCARRLSDPEDIKECVNGVFADFCLRWEQYDPQKGSLRVYLCGIANLKALEQHRKNSSRLHAQESYKLTCSAVYTSIGEYSDLDEALENLEPLDARILYMKYYEGMTYGEIAAVLRMNPETVKKRGQRSLRRVHNSID